MVVVWRGEAESIIYIYRRSEAIRLLAAATKGDNAHSGEVEPAKSQ